MTVAEELLAQANGKALIGDTGYDSNTFVQAVRDRGMKPIIHSKPERKKKHRLDRALYRKRYLVEVFFHRLNDFEPSRLAMRRPRATISRWSNSIVRGCGLAEAKLGVRAAGDSSEAARPGEARGGAGGGKGPRASAASVRARAPASRDRGPRPACTDVAVIPDVAAGRVRTREPSAPRTRAARPMACGHRGGTPAQARLGRAKRAGWQGGGEGPTAERRLPEWRLLSFEN